MNWDEIYDQIPVVVENVREKYVLNNTIIKDDIFKILEKYCVVVYYPFETELKNRGFHIKRFLNGELTDFVYINTAKSVAEQVFGAAHELGHVWRVAAKIWEKLGYNEKLTEEIEEIIVNRFAAVLLMPEKEFKKTFEGYLKDMGYDDGKIRFEEIIRVMVMQMTDYMVPYEAVRRRMIEIGIVSEKDGNLLDIKRNSIEDIIKSYLKDLNTTLSNSTMKKTIPGLRDVISKAEKQGDVSEAVLLKIKKDFEIDEIDESHKFIDISGEYN